MPSPPNPARPSSSRCGPIAAGLLHVALLLAAAGAGPAGATVLRFDQAVRGGTLVTTDNVGGAPPAGYGSHVGAAAMPVPGGALTYDEAGEGFTPDVRVELFATGATAADSHVRLWHEGYGNLVNVAFTEGPGVSGAPELFVRLTADPGFVVDLYGFDLAAFGGADRIIAGIQVFGGSTLLHELHDVRVEGDATGLGYTPIGFGAGPLSAPELLVRLDLSNLPAGIQDNIGLDNLRFGQTPPPPIVQVVPAPSVATLLVAAAWAAGARRRRRQGPARARSA